MSKRAADTELLREEPGKTMCIQPRSQDRLQDVVRAAYITKEGQLSDSPITLIAINEDAGWYTMLYWPADEQVGLRVLRHFARPKYHDVAIVQALLHVCIAYFKGVREDEDDALLCKTFGVASVKELGIFREMANACPQHSPEPGADYVDASDLNPSRFTALMYCYE